MLVALELFIKNSDSVPELRVFDVVKAIKRVLISIKTFLEIIYEEITVS